MCKIWDLSERGTGQRQMIHRSIMSAQNPMTRRPWSPTRRRVSSLLPAIQPPTSHQASVEAMTRFCYKGTRIRSPNSFIWFLTTFIFLLTSMIKNQQLMHPISVVDCMKQEKFTLGTSSFYALELCNNRWIWIPFYISNMMVYQFVSLV
jgi:hypothetical protein